MHIRYALRTVWEKLVRLFESTVYYTFYNIEEEQEEFSGTKIITIALSIE